MSKEKHIDKVKVVIDDWPKKSWLLEYTPVFIALIALLVSLYSVHLTMESFIVSHRPYVWANNYAAIDPDKKIMIPMHNAVAFHVFNAPAKIKRIEVRIDLAKEKLLDYTQNNIVRYPDDTKTQWNHSFSYEDIKKQILILSDADKAKLFRFIDLEYSALDGGKIYYYKLKQSFDPAEQQWKYDNQDAN